MSVALDFTEEQLGVRLMQHTSLDADHDLRVAFEDDGSLRQELPVAPEGEAQMLLPIDRSALRAAYARVRATPGAAWSRWTHVA